MTPSELASYIRYKTRTNTTTFTNAQILPIVKLRQDEISRKLMNSLHEDEDIFLTPYTRNLIASATSREYSQPEDLLSRIKRVEATFDGENWIKLSHMDMSEYKYTHDETTIISNFANSVGMAKYDIRRKALWIYSGTITAVTGGLKLWCFSYPAYVSDLTDAVTDMATDPTATTLGFPREFHELLARGVIIDYKESREKPIPLSEREQKYEYDLAVAIQAVRHGDQSREIFAQIPPASDRGNNGMNY